MAVLGLKTTHSAVPKPMHITESICNYLLAGCVALYGVFGWWVIFLYTQSKTQRTGDCRALQPTSIVWAAKLKLSGGDFIKTRIRQIRKEHGLTQAEFGRRIGITDASCSLIESGRNNPSGQTVRAICREFGVNEEWLRTGEGQKEVLPTDEDTLLLDEILSGVDSPFYQMIRKTLRVYMDLDADSKKVFNAVLERVAKENGGQE